MKLLDLLVRFFQHVVNVSQALLICGDLRGGKMRGDHLKALKSISINLIINVMLLDKGEIEKNCIIYFDLDILRETADTILYL